MSTPVTLTVGSGHLFANRHVLMRVYPAGDVDCCPWPMPDDAEHRQRLAIALFDAREMGDIPGDTEAVTLPDGTRFYFDQYVP